jgi:hypothetical protein
MVKREDRKRPFLNVEHKRELKESKREYSIILKKCRNMQGKSNDEIPRFRFI